MKNTFYSFILYLIIGSLISTCAGDIAESYGTYGVRNRPLLKSFKGFKYDVTREGDGVYTFSYHAGGSSRTEHRDADGLVKGEYAFVAPEGNEVDVKYEADQAGFRVESDALPLSPDETDEVKKAREFFFQEYQKALERLAQAEEEEEEHEEEEEEEESEEESEEDDDSDDDEDSSDESSEEDEDALALYAYYGFGPSNVVDDSDEDSSESSEESDEDDEEEEEEEEEEEKNGAEITRRGSRFFTPAAFDHFGRRLTRSLHKK